MINNQIYFNLGMFHLHSFCMIYHSTSQQVYLKICNKHIFIFICKNLHKICNIDKQIAKEH